MISIQHVWQFGTVYNNTCRFLERQTLMGANGFLCLVAQLGRGGECTPLCLVTVEYQHAAGGRNRMEQ